MTNKNICVKLAFIFAMLCIVPAAMAEGPPKVIILTLSGVRNSESIDDPDLRFMPNFFGSIGKKGCLYRKVISESLNFHMDVDQSVMTGKSYDYIESLTQPSLLQMVRKRYLLDREKVWGIGYWGEFQSHASAEGYKEETFPVVLPIVVREKQADSIADLLDEDDKRYLAGQNKMSERKLSTWPIWDGLNTFQTRIFTKIMERHAPVFMHFIMGAPEIAHCDTFAKYLVALKGCDDVIQQVFDMIQNNPAYKDNTYLIVFPDHGRNPYYQGHHLAFNVSQSSWLYIYGPDIKKGAIIDREVNIVDLYPTIAQIMRIPLNENARTPLTDCFLQK